MKTLNIRCSFIVLLLIALVALEKAGNTAPPLEQHGKLVVLVRLGDIDNSPATNVYVEAYGFVRQYRSKKSFILRASQAGRYEGSLPTGVYDVFVSEGVSIPKCRRLRITADHPTSWAVNLDLDEVYTEK